MIQDCISMIQDNQNITSIEEHNLVMHQCQLTSIDLHQQQHLQFQQHQHMQQQQQQHQQHLPQHILQSTALLYQHNNSNSAQLIQLDEKVLAEIANTSDASTVEDPIDENEIPNDEAFPYLQGLNSDNLMQFSQQSALQALMNEQLDVKPNLDVLPTFEEHDIGGYKFQLNLCPQRKGKANWIYSDGLNKVYIRMNEIFSIEASYMPKVPMQKLRIRALLSFVKEVSEPVLRCQNHLSVDTETLPAVRLSLLRCENPTAEYCGKAQGKSLNDRFCILIPLNNSLKSGSDNTQKQTIAFKFTCQNSCIGRKETSIIFLLESLNGEILSQRVIDVKVCSCPKRDRAVDERHLEIPKRKMEEDLYPRKKKVLKPSSSKSPYSVKEECTDSELDENSSDSNPQKIRHIQRRPSGGYRIVLDLPSKEIALHAIECGLNKTVTEMFNKTPNYSSRYARDIKQIKKAYDEISKH